jgi:hypothetical protein
MCEIQEALDSLPPLPTVAPGEIRIVIRSGLVEDISIGSEVGPVIITTADYDHPENMDPGEIAEQCHRGENDKACAWSTESPTIVK